MKGRPLSRRPGNSRLSELIPRFDRSRRGPDLDIDLPAVVLRVSQFPLQHGCLGVFRTLGRAGVPVYAVVADPCAPVARSRYVRGRILWQPHRGERHDVLLERLIDFAENLGKRSLIVCTSDEMAVWVARNRSRLEKYFVLPDVKPELPAILADKNTFSAVCEANDVAIPASVAVDTMPQLDAAIDRMGLPVILKSTALRGAAQNVENTTLVTTREDLYEIAQGWSQPFRVLLQDYLPDQDCDDWFTHGFCDDTGVRVVFTGRKVRTWPARGGATAAAYTAPNAELAGLTRSFCEQIGYRGVFDIDWRFDRRTGRYYMLDFNPRVGAQFRIFEDDAGIDVVRAMHLGLSGRAIPVGSQAEGERFVVEPWDMASILAGRHRPLDGMGGTGRPRVAWLAGDDLAPFAAVALTQIGRSIAARLHGPSRRGVALR